MAEAIINSHELSGLEDEWRSNPSQTSCARLADLLRQAGRFDEAIELATEGLRQWPASTSIEIVMGKCCRDSGKFDGAMGAFRSVLDRQPQNLVALRSMAEITFESKRWREAVDHLEEYLLEHPGDQEARDMLDEARSRCERMPQVTGNELDAIDPQQDSVDEQVFPETERMNRILREQGLPVNDGQDDSLADDTVRMDDPIGREVPAEAASLLDLFTEEEREELDLRSFEGELE